MAGVRLQWAQFGKVDSFNIYRSETPIDLGQLPEPIAVGVTQPEYWDITILKNKYYYYTIAAKQGTSLSVSDEQLSVITSNNNFIFPVSEGYAPPLTPNVNFIW